MLRNFVRTSNWQADVRNISGLSTLATRITRDFQQSGRNGLELLADWLKSPSLAQCPAVTHATPNAANALNTKLEINHGQQPFGWGR